jgi:hypothetical protein
MALHLRLWKDDSGFIVSSELILLATVVVIGLISGMATVRDQTLMELGDVADAVSELNQSYSYAAITAHGASVAGGAFLDAGDFCDLGGDGDQFAEFCVQGIGMAEGAGEQ